jgi:hypothetical protein
MLPTKALKLCDLSVSVAIFEAICVCCDALLLTMTLFSMSNVCIILLYSF